MLQENQENQIQENQLPVKQVTKELANTSDRDSFGTNNIPPVPLIHRQRAFSYNDIPNLLPSD